MTCKWFCDSCKRETVPTWRYGLLIPEWGDGIQAYITFPSSKLYCHMCVTEAMNDKPEVQYL